MHNIRKKCSSPPNIFLKDELLKCNRSNYDILHASATATAFSLKLLACTANTTYGFCLIKNTLPDLLQLLLIWISQGRSSWLDNGYPSCHLTNVIKALNLADHTDLCNN